MERCLKYGYGAAGRRVARRREGRSGRKGSADCQSRTHGYCGDACQPRSARATRGFLTQRPPIEPGKLSASKAEPRSSLTTAAAIEPVTCEPSDSVSARLRHGRTSRGTAPTTPPSSTGARCTQMYSGRLSCSISSVPAKLTVTNPVGGRVDAPLLPPPPPLGWRSDLRGWVPTRRLASRTRSTHTNPSPFGAPSGERAASARPGGTARLLCSW